MVRRGSFEKFLKMVFWLSRPALEIVLSGHDILLIGAVHFLIIIVSTGSNPLGVPLLQLLATLSAFLNAFAGGFGWGYPTTAEDCFPIT
jgi:hypothetical protein